MKRRGHHFLIGIGVTLALSSLEGAARACSCVPPSQKEAFEHADAVFLGTVEKFYDLYVVEGWAASTATIRVKTIWKGAKQPIIQVSTNSDEGMCGYPFVEGSEYLVYATRPREETSPDALWTWLCSRTSPTHEANEELRLLGPGTPIVP